MTTVATLYSTVDKMIVVHGNLVHRQNEDQYGIQERHESAPLHRSQGRADRLTSGYHCLYIHLAFRFSVTLLKHNVRNSKR